MEINVPGQVFAILMYSIVICLSTGGNFLVCYTVMTSRRMRTAINMFIVSLAISDLLMATFCIPFSFIANIMLYYWPFGRIMCPIVTYLQTVFVFMSSFTLIAISVDRYIAIIHPFRVKLSKRHAAITILVIWCLSFVLPLPTALTSDVVVYPNSSSGLPICRETWHQTDVRENDRRKAIYSLFILSLHYLLPLLVLLGTYGRIVAVMWIKKVPGEAETSRDRRISESKKKIIKMMVAVVIIYAVCWLPLHIITIAGDIDDSIYDNVSNMALMWMFAHWLAMSNSCYNPMVYCWMNSRFRDGFKRVLCCLCCKWNGSIHGSNAIQMRSDSTFSPGTSTTLSSKQNLAKVTRDSHLQFC